MRPKSDPSSLSGQRAFISDIQPKRLEFINLKHPLVVMADKLNWENVEVYWSRQFSSKGGPMASSGRLVAGLLMLKHMEGLSDERLIDTGEQSLLPIFLRRNAFSTSCSD